MVAGEGTFSRYSAPGRFLHTRWEVMVTLPSDPYSKALQSSGLLTPAQLKELAEIAAHQSVLNDEDATACGIHLGERAVASGWITAWQHEQLKTGRLRTMQIGKYRLLSHLGSGAMGDVYLAEHVQMQRRVAVKVLPPALVESPTHLQRFYQESRATAALDHPNIVKAYDIDHDGPTSLHYIVMEYVEGVDLAKLVQLSGHVKSTDAAEYIRQAALGLAHAHARGLVHRDIKPNNLLVDQEGRVKILDMGIARILGQTDSQSLTLVGGDGVMGTVDYLAPEQLINSHTVDGRADIYSLGCTLFFLLCGKAPFAHGPITARMMAHHIQPPPDPRDIRGEIPPELSEICLKMLAKQPELRYQTGEELAEVLSTWLGREESSLDVSWQDSTCAGGGTMVGGISISSQMQVREGVLAELVEKRVLTPLQAEILRGGASERLSYGDYVVLDRIESGRLAGMIRARHATYHDPVCLKTTRITGYERDRERQLQRFQHEADLSCSIQHPNVVATFEAGVDGDQAYLVFEDLYGRSLYEMLTYEERPSLSEACRIAHGAALGLAALHELSIVHRHVTPANIWLSHDGWVKVIDLTLARYTPQYLTARRIEDRSVTGPDFAAIIGSPEYLAPEATTSGVDATARSDIYGLGCTLYHLLTGQPPLGVAAPSARGGPANPAAQASLTDVPPPSRLNRQVPHELDELVRLMTSRSPTQRVRSAAAAAGALEAFL